MAWQVLNHSPHHVAVSGAGGHATNQHHGRSFDGSLASGVITLSVIVVSLLLAPCAVRALAPKRTGLMLGSLGMATMLLVTQLMHCAKPNLAEVAVVLPSHIDSTDPESYMGCDRLVFEK